MFTWEDQCVMILGSGNGLVPVWHQLPFEPLKLSFSKILIKIQNSHPRKCILKYNLQNVSINKLSYTYNQTNFLFWMQFNETPHNQTWNLEYNTTCTDITTLLRYTQLMHRRYQSVAFNHSYLVITERLVSILQTMLYQHMNFCHW